MLKHSSRERLLQCFFDEPMAAFQLRELSRKAKLAPTSVKRYLEEFKRESIIKTTPHRIHSYPTYQANQDNDYFRLLKRLELRRRLEESGLIDYLYETCYPTAIVLFGSAERGEDTDESDIDILLVCNERKLDLEEYESILKRPIQLFFCDELRNLSVNLRSNVMNGTTLRGFADAFEDETR